MDNGEEGVPYDFVMATAKKGLAEDMCLRYHMPKSASFSIPTYTEDIAILLAKVWAHKHTFMLGKWVEQACSKAFDLKSSLEGYEEPGEVA